MRLDLPSAMGGAGAGQQPGASEQPGGAPTGQAQPGTPDFNAGAALPGLGLEAGHSIRENLAGISGNEAWFSDGYAKVTQQRGAFDQVMRGAASGVGATQQHEYATTEEAARESMRMANETLHLSDQEFEKLLRQLETEANNAPVAPMRETPQQPGMLEQGVTSFFAALTPEHSVDILGAPYRASARRSEQDFQNRGMKYESDVSSRKDRQGLIRTKLDLWEQRRREAADQLQRGAQDLARMGDKNRSEAMQWRSSFYGADSEEEVRYAARILREQYRATGLAPSKAEEDGQVKNLLEKKKADRLTKRMAYIGEWRRLTDPGKYGGFSDDEARDFNTVQKPQFEAALNEGLNPGDPGYVTLPMVKSGPTLARENADFAKERWSSQFEFAKDKRADQLAQFKANYDLAKQRLDISRQNNDVAGFNAATGRMNALRLQAQAELKTSGAQKEYESNEAKILEMEGKKADLEENAKPTGEIDAKLHNLYKKRQAFQDEFGEFGLVEGPLGMQVPGIQMNFPPGAGKAPPLSGTFGYRPGQAAAAKLGKGSAKASPPVAAARAKTGTKGGGSWKIINGVYTFVPK